MWRRSVAWGGVDLLSMTRFSTSMLLWRFCGFSSAIAVRVVSKDHQRFSVKLLRMSWGLTLLWGRVAGGLLLQFRCHLSFLKCCELQYFLLHVSSAMNISLIVMNPRLFTEGIRHRFSTHDSESKTSPFAFFSLFFWDERVLIFVKPLLSVGFKGLFTISALICTCGYLTISWCVCIFLFISFFLMVCKSI